MSRIGVLALLVLLCGCAISPGAPVDQNAAASGGASAYVPLYQAGIIVKDWASATVIAPGVAVTADYNAALVDPKSLIGKSAHCGLVFFRTGQTAVLATAAPRMGRPIIVYGQGAERELRRANGVIRELGAPVTASCASCGERTAFTFAANAGNGFGGGPVLDADGLHLIGMYYGYVEQRDGSLLQYGFDIGRIQAEYHAVTAARGN